MGRYTNELDNKNFTIRLQWIFIGILAILAFYAMTGWRNAPKDFTAHIPPDLRSGATLRVGGAPEVPPANVYLFASYIWQQVNRWKNNGAKDYGTQIFAMQNYITPACREQLVADMNNKSSAGELTERTRSIAEIPGQSFEDKRVTLISGDTWSVLLDMQLLETSRGETVKDVYIRYPVQVVRFDVDRELNPYGLAIDCFGNKRPERLDPKAYKMVNAPVPDATGPAPAMLPSPLPH